MQEEIPTNFSLGHVWYIEKGPWIAIPRFSQQGDKYLTISLLRK
jgi:hypothetical protein